MADHPFERSANPRMERACVRCGRVPEAHPRREPDPERDPWFERLFVEAACAGRVDPAPLVEMAQQRAHPGPVRGFIGRDFDREALEECADVANYVPWGDQQDAELLGRGVIDEETRSQRQQLRARALARVAEAFELLRVARGLGR